MYSNAGTNDMALGYTMGRDSNNGCCNNGNGNGMWGDSWWIVIILFALIFGWNGNGNWGGNNGSGGMNYVPYAVGSSYTDSAIQRGFDTQSIVGKLDGITNGLCDGFYAVNTSLLNGFNGVDNAICNLGYQTQNGFNATQVAMMQGQNAIQTQLADCCCKQTSGQQQIINSIDSNACATGRAIERGFCDTNYNLATNTTAIIQSTHNDTDRIIAKLDAMEMSRKDETIAALREQLSQARFSASQSAQNAFFQANQDAQTAEILRRTGHDCPSAAYIVQPPTPVSFPTNCCGQFNGWGYNGGCGCNSGCGF